MMDEKPTMIEGLEEYERPAVEHAEELRTKYGEAVHAALQATLYVPGVGWVDVEEDAILAWGNPKPVRQDYYVAWRNRDFGRRFMATATSDTISYEVLALAYGKPQKRDYKRARDFRAARRRHARWKKGRP